MDLVITEKQLVAEDNQENHKCSMNNICKKLRLYAYDLKTDVEYGIITLSEQEMMVIREFLRKEKPYFEKTLLKWAGEIYTWNTNMIPGLESDKENYIIMGFGIWDYEGYKFVLHCERKLIYLDKKTQKSIVITNSVDYPDDNYAQYDTIILGNNSNTKIGKRCKLLTEHDACYVYYESEKSICIERFLFGDKLKTWTGVKTNYDKFNYFSNPSIITRVYEDNIHFIFNEGQLLCFRENEDVINVIAEEISTLEDIVIPNWSKNTLLS